jgi:hypothetical protein
VWGGSLSYPAQNLDDPRHLRFIEYVQVDRRDRTETGFGDRRDPFAVEKEVVDRPGAAAVGGPGDSRLTPDEQPVTRVLGLVRRVAEDFRMIREQPLEEIFVREGLVLHSPERLQSVRDSLTMQGYVANSTLLIGLVIRSWRER